MSKLTPQSFLRKVAEAQYGQGGGNFDSEETARAAEAGTSKPMNGPGVSRDKPQEDMDLANYRAGLNASQREYMKNHPEMAPKRSAVSEFYGRVLSVMSDPVVAGGVSGAAVGGVLGALIDKRNRWRGGAIGTAAGAAIGAGGGAAYRYGSNALAAAKAARDAAIQMKYANDADSPEEGAYQAEQLQKTGGLSKWAMNKRAWRGMGGAEMAGVIDTPNMNFPGASANKAGVWASLQARLKSLSGRTVAGAGKAWGGAKRYARGAATGAGRAFGGAKQMVVSHPKASIGVGVLAALAGAFGLYEYYGQDKKAPARDALYQFLNSPDYMAYRAGAAGVGGAAAGAGIGALTADEGNEVRNALIGAGLGGVAGVGGSLLYDEYGRA